MSYSKIGRYEIVGTLGKGAMGVVYKAVDPTIGRTVALKTTRLDVHGTEQEELLERFRNEARLAGVLNHPNIVTVYDAGEHEGLFYIAMEFIEGQTLHQLLAKKKVVPIAQTLEIARQVCAGLDAAASHRVVHRDIKPANIMLEASGGTAKIMDFGIAKAGGGLTSTGQVLGTPNYMSPEQVRGKALDGRSDLFSLGVMLYEMVTGSKPFVGDNVTTIIYKIIHEDPPPPREVNVSVHPGLAAVIVKALEKNPNNRYQNGAELARDLANYKAIGDADEPTTRITPADGAETGTAAAAARAATSKPIFAASEPREATRSLPLFALLRSIAAVIAVVAIGIVAYVRHSQAQQRSELERLLAEQKPSAAAQPSTAPTPSTEINTTAPATTVAAGGELVLNTNPEGAQVRIDGRGQPSWRTPFITGELRPGAHTVAFSFPGYANESRSVDVSAGHQAFVAVTLKPAPLSASITSAPTGAEIFIDGADAGKTTPAQIPLSQGDHNLLLRKSGFDDLSTTLHTREGRPQNYSEELLPVGQESSVGRFKNLLTGAGKVPVTVHTSPKGAQIVINGVLAQGKTSPMRLGLDPGNYDVVLQLEGYKPLHKTVTIEKGTPLELDETLEKQN